MAKIDHTVLVKQIFDLAKKLGIKIPLGTRTNVTKFPKQANIGNTSLNYDNTLSEIQKGRRDKVLSTFSEELAYLPSMNNTQKTRVIENLKTLDDAINAPSAEVIDFQRASIDKTIKDVNKNMKSMGLEPGNNKDYAKYTDAVEKEGLPFDKPITDQGLASMMKNLDDSVKTLDDEALNLKNSLSNLETNAEKLKNAADDMAFQQERYGVIDRPADRQRDMYDRAVVRPFLIRQHDSGKINLSPEVYESLSKFKDLQGGSPTSDLKFPDPVDVFDYHYGLDNRLKINRDLREGDDIVASVTETLQDSAPLQTTGIAPPRYLTPNKLKKNIADIDESVRFSIENDGIAGNVDEEVAEYSKRSLQYQKYLPLDQFPDDVVPPKDNIYLEETEKSLGDKLKDYDGDPDAMASGGRVGMASGGYSSEDNEEQQAQDQASFDAGNRTDAYNDMYSGDGGNDPPPKKDINDNWNWGPSPNEKRNMHVANLMFNPSLMGKGAGFVKIEDYYNNQNEIQSDILNARNNGNFYVGPTTDRMNESYAKATGLKGPERPTYDDNGPDLPILPKVGIAANVDDKPYEVDMSEYERFRGLLGLTGPAMFNEGGRVGMTGGSAKPVIKSAVKELINKVNLRLDAKGLDSLMQYKGKHLNKGLDLPEDQLGKKVPFVTTADEMSGSKSEANKFMTGKRDMVGAIEAWNKDPKFDYYRREFNDRGPNGFIFPEKVESRMPGKFNKNHMGKFFTNRISKWGMPDKKITLTKDEIQAGIQRNYENNPTADVDDVLVSEDEIIRKENLGLFERFANKYKFNEGGRVGLAGGSGKTFGKALLKALDEVGGNFADGDMKYNADVLADELAFQKGLIPEGGDLTDIADQRIAMDLYDEAYSALSEQFRQQREIKKMTVDKFSKPTATLKGIEETGTIDISDPNVMDEFSTFMKESNPEGYKDLEQKIEIETFDPKDRKGSAYGGMASMMRKI